MSQASQRVSKLSRRAGRSGRQPPTSAPEPPDLDTSDDFTPSLSFARSRTRSTLSQSSCAAEPSSSQSQRLSGEIMAVAVSFCGVLDTVAQRAAGELFPPASDVRKTGSDRQAGERAAAGLPATRTAPPPTTRRTRTGQQVGVGGEKELVSRGRYSPMCAAVGGRSAKFRGDRKWLVILSIRQIEKGA
ncbi:hypothetical protein FJT64_022463 [Amphibalanus amphitrite]|uniref:Uncharacterized protein n=1 Tax=Amphibalanus amphitrite TaxID=1232801 RepID=A0A6A4WQF1_AMPAM|nr:hypothetical protein FJT64_022463 [Amphibalanus amphitrite]